MLSCRGWTAGRCSPPSRRTRGWKTFRSSCLASSASSPPETNQGAQRRETSATVCPAFLLGLARIMRDNQIRESPLFALLDLGFAVDGNSQRRAIDPPPAKAQHAADDHHLALQAPEVLVQIPVLVLTTHELHQKGVLERRILRLNAVAAVLSN